MLTIAALIAFVVIGLARFITHAVEMQGRYSGSYVMEPYIDDVRLPFFMLGVIYAGLFVLLADKKEKQW